MTVAELIAKLATMPPTAPIEYTFDDETWEVDHVWLARNGSVLVSEDGQQIYQPQFYPVGLPDDTPAYPPRILTDDGN